MDISNINGVTVLETIQAFHINNLLCGAVIIAILIILYMLLHIDFPTYMVLCIISACIWGIEVSETHDNQYKIVVDDTVTMNQIIENYDIIDIDGRIITIEEKETSK